MVNVDPTVMNSCFVDHPDTSALKNNQESLVASNVSTAHSSSSNDSAVVPLVVSSVDSAICTELTCIWSSTATIDDPSTAIASDSIGPTGRKRRSTLKALYSESEYPKKQKKSASPKTKEAESEFEMTWICAECKEAECTIQPDVSDLLICDGICRRVFHFPCVGLSELPPTDEPFLCTDCSHQKHACTICSNYGHDNEDVFQCSKKNCGLFYHESCLSMQNVDIVVIAERNNQPPDNVALTNQLRFVCPAHNCWTCTQVEMREQESMAARLEVATSATTAKKRASKKKVKKGNIVFESKSHTFLARCMECPIAYHVTCIPPTARFHELATLCHEHAGNCKLPELDLNDSIQGQIEKKIDEKFHQRIEKIESRQKRDRKNGKNLFFAGLSGQAITVTESNILSLLEKDNDCNGSSCLTKDQLWFCLPCDIKKEVHSKPPNYRHVHSLQYSPSHRPPRIPPADDVCQCVFTCGEDCINRMLYTECYGDTANVTGRARDSNCAVGPNCSNRQLGNRAGAKCKPQREQGKGWGLVPLNKVSKGDLVQEYVGEVVDEATKVKRLNEWYQEHPNDPNFYLMALQPGWFIDARDVANLSRFINHSCDPNCVLQQINVNGRMRCGIFALRDIQPDEFLSYDYHFDTKHGDRFVCCCGSQNCRGTMKYGKLEDDASNKSKAALWDSAKANFERDKKFLLDYEEDCRQRSSQVGAMLPGADCGDEYVANGAQEKHRVHGQRHRLLLWRNVELGNDMASRLMKLDGLKS